VVGKEALKHAALVAVATSALLSACARPSQDPEEPTKQAILAATGVFREMAAASGLDFVHRTGESGDLRIAEVMGAGVALFDYDGDGDLDVYLVQGGALPGEETRAETDEIGDRLFRNDLGAGLDDPRRLRFTDVTADSRIPVGGYGMGAIAGDIDNDGWTDLYVTNLGPNRMLRNRGDGTFEDITASSDTADERWSLSASFVDLDRDGWLDLYVSNYVDFALAGGKRCRSMTGAPDYCGPLTYRPLRDRLLHNLGRGRFENWTTHARVGAAGSGLGVVSGDFDSDGRPDLYVTNDGMPNFLWMQQPDGRFLNEALSRGCALSLEGMAEASMGVGAGDCDGDGDEDLLVTHLALETNTLYRNDGSGSFDDVSRPSGAGAPSFAYTGFGAAWIDYDNDGWLDLMAVNGAVKLMPELVALDDPRPLHMPNQLLRNTGNGIFEDATGLAGGGWGQSEVSRGLAVGDLDNDGDVDAVVTNNGGGVRLFLNEVGNRNHWVGLRLVGGDPPRDMIGAWVGAQCGTGPTRWRRARTDGSYLSSSDPRVLIGLGRCSELQRVSVLWPSGLEESFRTPADTYTTLREGSGERQQNGD
jgi:hypothetical protein